MVIDGYEWLYTVVDMVVDGYEWLYMVVDGYGWL